MTWSGNAAQAAGPSVLARGPINSVVLLLKKLTRVTRILRLMRLVRLFQQYLVRLSSPTLFLHGALPFIKMRQQLERKLFRALRHVGRDHPACTGRCRHPACTRAGLTLVYMPAGRQGECDF